MITALDIIDAQRRIARFVAPTPLRESHWLSRRAGGRVRLKLESVQLTNSFKIRGAFNAALHVVADAVHSKTMRIVTASAGNHGQALALACARLGLPLTVFTPAGAPETKKAAIRSHAADLRDDCADYDAAEAAARQFAEREGGRFISPYNDRAVIAGAGTVALEVFDALPSFDVLIVPLGGGGLASGLGTFVKAVAPRVRIVGVEAAASTPFATSIRVGSITAIEPTSSLADGLTGNLEPNTISFDIVRRVVDDVISVDEENIADAIAQLAAEEHVITEGAGAVATAAVLARNVVRRGETAIVMVTGANIDAARLNAVLATRRLA